MPFYFGFLSPMMFRLKTGWVAGYREGQRPLIYLITTAQRIRDRGTPFVFTDGHGLANFTRWFDNLGDLEKVDWEMVYQRYWTDDVTGDNDRQRRKQAEFLVHQGCGLGGLSWGVVAPMIAQAFEQLPDVHVLLYAPHGAPDAKAMPVHTKFPT